MKLSPQAVAINNSQVCVHLPSLILLTAVYAAYTLHIPTVQLHFGRIQPAIFDLPFLSIYLVTPLCLLAKCGIFAA